MDVYDKFSISTTSRFTADEEAELQQTKPGRMRDAVNNGHISTPGKTFNLSVSVSNERVKSGEPPAQSPVCILRSANIHSKPRCSVSSTGSTISEPCIKSPQKKEPQRQSVKTSVIAVGLKASNNCNNMDKLNDSKVERSTLIVQTIAQSDRDNLTSKGREERKSNECAVLQEKKKSTLAAVSIQDDIPIHARPEHVLFPVAPLRVKSRRKIELSDEVFQSAPLTAIDSVAVAASTPQPLVSRVERVTQQSKKPLLQVPMPLFQQRSATSSASIQSSSPTETSASSCPGATTQSQKRTSIPSKSTTTTLAMFTAAGPSHLQSKSQLDLGLDVDHFRIVFKELTVLTEKMQDLNDQIIHALTLYPQSIQQSLQELSLVANIAVNTISETKTTLSSASSTKSISSSSEESSDPSIIISESRYTREEKGKDKAGSDLEDEQLIIAQTITNLIESAWPRVYKIPSEPQNKQMINDRIKIATKLKNIIVMFWSIQSHYQDQVQLILDLYQDPAQFGREDRILILKSKHLNNLLSNPEISAARAEYLLAKFHVEQENHILLSDRLQAVWLGILLLLGDPEQTRSFSRSHEMDVGSHLWKSGHQHYQMSSSFMSSLSPLSESRRWGCFRLSGDKRLGLKVAVLLLLGAGMIGMALVINAQNSSKK
ncbi:hypothetical protein BG004_005438 [Podila humilis]|nr:hypothetical protein BG004_005438 [Podila humilis]